MTTAVGTSETHWRPAGAVLPPSRLEQIREVLDRAAGLSGRPPEDVTGLLGAPPALSALDGAWHEVARAVADRGLHPDQVGIAVDLLGAIRDAETVVRDDQTRHDVLRSEAVRCALSDLHYVNTMAELVTDIPEAVSNIGFDRVLLSWVEDSLWVPVSIHARRDAGWAEEIVQAGRQDLRILDKRLLETEIVRRKRPLSVAETVGRPNLHQALIDASRTRSYVAAPLTAGGRVIGFLHADCYAERRRVDATDRDLLWMFCEGVSQLAARVATLDALHSIRSQLGALATSPSADADECWASGEASHPPRYGTSVLPLPVPSGDNLEGALTRREVEVMRLMAQGLTNGQIGRRLVIAEGTAKSHVKQILRKLNATNRAEAVSRWLRDQHTRQLPVHGMSLDATEQLQAVTRAAPSGHLSRRK